MMTAPATHPKKTERTCVGCAKTGAPSEMVRLVLLTGQAPVVDGPDYSNTVVVDAAAGAFGRGAHVHPSRECLEAACRGGLSKAFKANVHVDVASLRPQIRVAYARRAVGMILGARRAGHLAIGADKALESKDAPLIVIASDAGSIVGKLERAVASGRAIIFGNKAELGQVFGAGETAVFAVRHEGVARALKDVIGVVHGTEER